MSSPTLDDLFRSDRWGAVAPPRAGVSVVSNGADRWTQIAHLSEAYKIVTPEEQALLADTMNALSQSIQAGADGDPIAERLVEQAIEKLGPYASTDPSGAAAAFIESVRDADIPKNKLLRTMIDFVDQIAIAPMRSAASFSFVLFRKSDHKGAVYASFQDGTWPQHIRPPEGTTDTHLALIPPPTAENAVTQFAADLGISESKLPCVVFVGRELATEAGSAADRLGNALAAWPLAEGKPYTEQLGHIYSRLYATDLDALIGRQSVAIFDRLIMERRWTWLRVAASLALGPKAEGVYSLIETMLGEAPDAGGIIEGVRTILSPPKAQLNPGTVIVYQNGQPCGEVYTEYITPNLYREHWFLHASFDRSEDYEIKWRPPAQWDQSYAQFKTRMLGTPAGQGGYTYLRSEASYFSAFL